MRGCQGTSSVGWGCGIAGLSEFFLDAAERLSRDIAAMRFQKCTEVLNACVRIGNNGLFFVDGQTKFKLQEVLDVGYQKNAFSFSIISFSSDMVLSFFL